MKLLDSLKFVQNATTTSGQQAYAHFNITGGRVTATNGYIALSAPIDLNISCKPKADMLVRALTACGDAARLSANANGSLLVRGKTTRVTVGGLSDNFVYPDTAPQGTEFSLSFDVIGAFRTLKPFVGIYDEPSWINTVLISPNGCLVATDSAKLIQMYVGHHITRSVTLPLLAVDTLLKIGENPTHMTVDGTSVTFSYSDGRYLRTALRISSPWPDLTYLLDVPHNAVPIPDDFKAALRSIATLADVDEGVTISKNSIRASSDDGTETVIEFESSVPEGMYTLSHLLRVIDVASVADFSLYPKPAPFFGDNIRGAIIGRIVQQPYEGYGAEPK